MYNTINDTWKDNDLVNHSLMEVKVLVKIPFPVRVHRSLYENAKFSSTGQSLCLYSEEETMIEIEI